MPEPRETSSAEEESLLAFLVSCADEIAAHSTEECPEPNALSAFADGATGAEERAVLETHLSLCPGCRAAVAAIAAASLAATRAAPGAPPPSDAGFPRPFGAYLLHRRLGGGGMGDVFEASHPQRERREALKQLRAGLDDDPRAAERFLREIRAVSAIAHDQVVALHDSGVVDGIAYYTMPLLPGPSLARLLAEIRGTGERPPGREAEKLLDRAGLPAAPRASGDPATDYARRIAAALAGVGRGLAALHAAGMVHRDVKPSNIVLDGRGKPVLTDFGLVRIDAQRMTRTGEALGTPAYMAPEQLLPGAAVGPGADLYALGATLYEALALHPPHEGASLAETVARVVRGGPRPLREAAPGLPREFDVVAGRCLERLPSDRYADAEALARDLEACAAGEPVAAKPLSPLVRAARAAGRRRKGLLLVAIALAAAVGWAATRGGRIAIRALPSALVEIDGEAAGTTPLLGRRVAAGEHVVRLAREGFEPLARTIAVERGGTYDLDVVLRALDPADPAALALLASALGVERAEVAVEVARSPGAGAPLAVLLPRGALREPPAEISIWAEEPAKAVTVRLERDASKLHEWKAETVFRQSRLAVPDAIRASLGPGAYRLAAAAAEGPEATAEFEILPEERSARIAEEIARVRGGFGPGDLAADFVAADLLLSRGLVGETLAAAAALRQTVGDRREVARLVLAALDRAGLRDTGPWPEWASTFLRAER